MELYKLLSRPDALILWYSYRFSFFYYNLGMKFNPFYMYLKTMSVLPQIYIDCSILMLFL